MSRFISYLEESITNSFTDILDNAIFEHGKSGALSVIDFLTLYYQHLSGNEVNVKKLDLQELTMGIDPTTRHFYVSIGKRICYTSADIRDQGITGDIGIGINKLLRIGPSLNIKDTVRFNIILADVKKLTTRETAY